jgi:hypothetical protein
MSMTLITAPMLTSKLQQTQNYFTCVKKNFCVLDREENLPLNLLSNEMVKVIELTAPSVSTLESLEIKSRLEDEPLISNAQKQKIWRWIHSTEGLIFTLGSFLRDVHWIEDLANRIQWLVTVRRNEAVCDAIGKVYVGGNQRKTRVFIQVTETKFEVIPGTEQDRIELGCRQLFLFILRNHKHIPKFYPNVVTPLSAAHQAVLCSMAGLAVKLGFESLDILELLRYPSLKPLVSGGTYRQNTAGSTSVPKRSRNGMEIMVGDSCSFITYTAHPSKKEMRSRHFLL